MASELLALIKATEVNEEITPHQRAYLLSAISHWERLSNTDKDRLPPIKQLKTDFESFKRHFNTPYYRKHFSERFWVNLAYAVRVDSPPSERIGTYHRERQRHPAPTPQGAHPQTESRQMGVKPTKPLHRLESAAKEKQSGCGIDVTGRGKKIDFSGSDPHALFEQRKRPTFQETVTKPEKKTDLKEFFQELIKASQKIEPEVERFLVLVSLLYLEAQLELPKEKRNQKMIQYVWRFGHNKLTVYKLLEKYREDDLLKTDLKEFMAGR